MKDLVEVEGHQVRFLNERVGMEVEKLVSIAWSMEHDRKRVRSEPARFAIQAGMENIDDAIRTMSQGHIDGHSDVVHITSQGGRTLFKVVG